jgi:hypothetical protein
MTKSDAAKPVQASFCLESNLESYLNYDGRKAESMAFSTTMNVKYSMHC